MAIFTLVFAIALVGFSILMFMYPDYIMAKLNLTVNWVRMLALIVLLVGLWFALAYFGENITLRLMDKLKSIQSPQVSVIPAATVAAVKTA